jgi:hypothetical protein
MMSNRYVPGFGCGATLGFILGSISSLSDGFWLALLAGVALAVPTGLLSARYGERVMVAVLEWLSP